MFKDIVKGWFSRDAFLGKGGYAEIWHIAWPFIILNAANTVMMVTNRIFLSKHSSAEMAASMPAGQLFFTFMILFLITTGFTATIVAQYHGAGDKLNCIRASWNGFYFSAGISFLLCFLFPLLGPMIFSKNGHDPAIAKLELEYFLSVAPCAAFSCLETPLFAFFTGRGKTKILAMIKASSCLLCVPLNYVLVFGKCGIPELGILGAGLANSLANSCSFLTILTCFLLVNQSEYPTRTHKEFRWEIVKKLLFFGTPAGFQGFLRNIGFAIVVMMIGRLGNEALAATSIALCINMVGNMPIFGMADATGILTGQYIGKKDLNTAESIFAKSFRMLVPWLTITGILYIFEPEFLIDLFGSNDSTGKINMGETIRIVRYILLLATVFNFFDALRFLLMGALRGAGDTKVPLFIGIGTAWGIQMPGTVLLVMYFHSTIQAVWLLLTCYIATDALLMLWRRKTGAWKKIKLLDD
ncbi:MAG: MATE family efflux transporter [Lentisphaeria bacterium]|nr:MATE family efflux transporter [Lentisphaeria bacterium]